jgi:tRNA A-37 threonylcarbamoyl transferase component Bud32
LGPVDALLLKLLANNPPLTAEDARKIRTWWLANRATPRESLVEFLVRQDIFVPDATKTVDMLRKGLITFCDPRRLLRAKGLDTMRERLAQPAGAGAGPLTKTAVPGALATMRPPAAPANPAAAKPAASGGRAGDTEDIMSSALHPATPSTGLVIGTMLGNCLLTEPIGKGGSAQVFRAIHRGLNIPVAVKVLHREALERDPDLYAQLKSEAHLLEKLQHPNIIRVLEFDDNPQFPYLVLEYIEGLSLAELINQSGRLRLDRAMIIIRQIAEGLKAALELGVIHRDVKPANVLLTRDGHAKLADMGLAMAIRPKGEASSQSSDTGLEAMVGTVAYISPEQALSAKDLDHRADIYSLGATFYHAITGELPFQGRSRAEVLLKHVQEVPSAPHMVAPGLDPQASELVLQMMAKDPKDRIQTYDALLHALDGLRHRHDSSSIVMNTGTTNPGPIAGP